MILDELVLFLDLLAVIIVSVIYLIRSINDPNHNEERIDYNIDTNEGLLALMGISSVLLFILWFIELTGAREYLFGWTTIELPRNINYFGLIIVTGGSLLFVTSRIARKSLAPSWGLTESMRLITGGPYRWIRHPSYSAYFSWFVGLPLATGNLLFLPLLFGIYGYYRVVDEEEKLLGFHFGDKFLEYRKNTKKFIPYIW